MTTEEFSSHISCLNGAAFTPLTTEIVDEEIVPTAAPTTIDWRT